jgi:hypothetical protein
MTITMPALPPELGRAEVAHDCLGLTSGELLRYGRC